jgi:hypothetical protein
MAEVSRRGSRRGWPISIFLAFCRHAIEAKQRVDALTAGLLQVRLGAAPAPLFWIRGQ